MSFFIILFLSHCDYNCLNREAFFLFCAIAIRHPSSSEKKRLREKRKSPFLQYHFVKFRCRRPQESLDFEPGFNLESTIPLHLCLASFCLSWPPSPTTFCLHWENGWIGRLIAFHHFSQRREITSTYWPGGNLAHNSDGKKKKLQYLDDCQDAFLSLFLVFVGWHPLAVGEC